tara:strand:- start:712 stop:1527 length:816 start_codon:yes stop_codon:yes gene_type:complete
MKLGKKRIHIAPVGFEVDRVVIPAVDNKADKVYLLVHNNKKEDKAGPYVERIIKQLKANKIESEKVQVNWRDVESITKSARRLILEQFGNDIFVNVASGSKNHAIALDRAIMTLEDQSGIVEFYAESEKYEGFKPGKQQLSTGVKDTKTIPKRQMILPTGKLRDALSILYKNNLKQEGTCTFPCKEDHLLQAEESKGDGHMWGSMRKKDLANECVKQDLIPSTGNILTALDKNIIQKLESDWDYIDINKLGQSHHVSLTTAGMAFVYEMSP